MRSPALLAAALFALGLSGVASAQTQPATISLHVDAVQVVPTVPVDLVVEVRDGAGAVVGAYAGRVTITCPEGLPAPIVYDFTPADAGRKRFVHGLRFASAGTFAVNASGTTEGTPIAGLISAVVVEPGAAAIVSTPRSVGYVGVPYAYSPQRRIVATGQTPISYSKISGPAGLTVDPNTGAVFWRPDATGTIGVELGASNSLGASSQTFSVVVEASPPALSAELTATPAEGPARTVAFSASTTATAELSYVWDFGDGSRAVTPEGSVTHRYSLPGSYVASLFVRDAGGAESFPDEVAVRVTGNGLMPPIAKISGPGGATGSESFEVAFNCQCSAGSAPIARYFWDFGDGHTSQEANPTHAFGPGRYWVSLVISDENGLAGWDKQEIVVTGGGKTPPQCTASVEPVTSAVPVSVRYSVDARPAYAGATITNALWTLADGSTGTALEKVFTFYAPGWRPATVEVTDSNGLKCRDSVAFVGFVEEGVMPLAILSRPQVPAPLTCGTWWEYKPVGVGIEQWSLDESPEGTTLEEENGKLWWTPSPSQTGQHVFTLRGSGEGQPALQSFTIDVQCGSAQLQTCGCGAAGAVVPSLALLGVLAALRRRRRR